MAKTTRTWSRKSAKTKDPRTQAGPSSRCSDLRANTRSSSAICRWAVPSTRSSKWNTPTSSTFTSNARLATTSGRGDWAARNTGPKSCSPNKRGLRNGSQKSLSKLIKLRWSMTRDRVCTWIPRSRRCQPRCRSQFWTTGLPKQSSSRVSCKSARPTAPLQLSCLLTCESKC